MASPIPLTSLSNFREIEPDKPIELKKEVPPDTDQTTPELLPEVLEKIEASSSPPLCELAPTERLLITRRLHVKPALFLMGKRNRFYVRTPDENLVYTVEEDSRLLAYHLKSSPQMVGWVSVLWSPAAAAEGHQLARHRSDEDSQAICSHYQDPAVLAATHAGTSIGTIEQQWTAINPLYIVKNKNGEPTFWIRGPKLTVSCFKDIQFQIVKADGVSVGATCKRWEGVMHALFLAPVTDRCGIAYDKDLSEEEKGLLLSATLLLNYMYYDV